MIGFLYDGPGALARARPRTYKSSCALRPLVSHSSLLMEARSDAELSEGNL